MLSSLLSWLASAFGKALADIVGGIRHDADQRRLGAAEANAAARATAEREEAAARAAAAKAAAAPIDDDDGFRRD
jgi:hypothetical protein